jgi:hypothetical protein
MNKQKEWRKLGHVAKTNGFPLSLIRKLNTGICLKTSPHIPNTHNTTQNMGDFHTA